MSEGRDITPGRIVAALLLPPLAVLLAQGGVGRDFWIACGLTCLAFVPGMVFAFYILLKGRRVSTPLPA